MSLTLTLNMLPSINGAYAQNAEGKRVLTAHARNRNTQASALARMHAADAIKALAAINGDAKTGKTARREAKRALNRHRKGNATCASLDSSEKPSRIDTLSSSACSPVASRPFATTTNSSKNAGSTAHPDGQGD